MKNSTNIKANKSNQVKTSIILQNIKLTSLVYLINKELILKKNDKREYFLSLNN